LPFFFHSDATPFPFILAGIELRNGWLNDVENLIHKNVQFSVFETSNENVKGRIFYKTTKVALSIKIK